VKTQTKRNLIGLAVVIVIVVVAAAALLKAKSNALEREIAAWEAAGYPLDPKELLPPAPPDAENAAVGYLEIMAGVDEDVPSPTEEDATAYLRKFGTDEELAALESDTPATVLVAARYASNADQLRDLLLTESPWVWPPSTYEGDLLPTTPRTLDASRVLVLQARALALQGEMSEAVRCLQAALRLSERTATFPALVAVIAHAAVDQAVLRAVEDIGRTQPIATTLLERELQWRHYRTALVRALNAEAAHVWTQREQWPSLFQSLTGLPLEPWGLSGDAAYYFSVMREAIGRLGEPYTEQDDPLWEPAEGGGGMFGSVLVPHFPGANHIVTQAEAHRRMALFAFELRRQKESLGSYQAALAATEVPISPITGEPFEVVIDEAGIVISTPPARGDEPLEWRWE
jgi:tetratricopeptide (TPR) repeat protein